MTVTGEGWVTAGDLVAWAGVLPVLTRRKTFLGETLVAYAAAQETQDTLTVEAALQKSTPLEALLLEAGEPQEANLVEPVTSLMKTMEEVHLALGQWKT